MMNKNYEGSPLFRNGILFLLTFIMCLFMQPQSAWSETYWQTIGPEGGRCDVIAIDPVNSQIVYAGTRGGGVFKTTNGGTSWTAINTGLTDYDVYALAIDPANSQIVYTGTSELLSKPTKLSKLEFSLIKEHVLSGYEILTNVDSPWPLAEIVYQHHERMDGSGYPRGLKGKEIVMDARILAVADVVEAMASNRPYRPALGEDAALKEIEDNRGVLYDAEVVDACLRVFREKSFHLEHDPDGRKGDSA
jgi:hypothetical protein